METVSAVAIFAVFFLLWFCNFVDDNGFRVLYILREEGGKWRGEGSFIYFQLELSLASKVWSGAHTHEFYASTINTSGVHMLFPALRPGLTSFNTLLEDSVLVFVYFEKKVSKVVVR